jgi:hypothetical protein
VPLGVIVVVYMVFGLGFGVKNTVSVIMNGVFVFMVGVFLTNAQGSGESFRKVLVIVELQ